MFETLSRSWGLVKASAGVLRSDKELMLFPVLSGLASLLVLAVASTNGQFGFARGGTYELTARFTNLGQLRPNAPVKIGGVTIGRVTRVDLDPVRFDSVVTLAVENRFNEIPVDTSAAILTGGLLGESYVGLSPGGDRPT